MNEYTILNNFHINSDFWEQNSHFLLLDPFKTFYKNDKSRKKKRSSKIMWAIALLVHPLSKFSDSSYEKRKEIIIEDFLDFETLDWDTKYSQLLDAFKEHAMTRKQVIVSMWGDKLDERMDMLSETKYTIENAEELDKAMARTEKIWNVYMQALKDLDDESSHNQVQGGAEESAEEKGWL
jgi:uncharacterized protein YecA (UPF0149 family)